MNQTIIKSPNDKYDKVDELDPRIICYETERPELEPLPKIPEEITEDKDTREWIIDSLSKEMAIFRGGDNDGTVGVSRTNDGSGSGVQPASMIPNQPETIDLADRSCWSIYDPEPDGDCLFKSMAWGLFILKKELFGPGCMRNQLMDSFCANPNTISGDLYSPTWREIALLDRGDNHVTANSLHDYATQIRTPRTWGGQLELLIFSSLFQVNVAIYESINNSQVYRIAPELSIIKSENTETVHLVYAGRQHYQLLCQQGLHPSESHILQDTTRFAFSTLTSLDTESMIDVYKKISEQLPGRNGYITQFNIFLTALMGCNTNSALLGSREQSKSALFYIGK